jgi:flagellar protein FliS
MNASTATKAYAKVDVESGALIADSHKLISMLYQGALLAIANAKNGMIRIANAKKTRNAKVGLQDITNKCTAISKAINIIDDGLNASLDKKVGGELAQNLSSLYDYMVMRLTQANMNNDLAALDEVARLLNDLKGAWEAMRTGSAVSSGAVAPPKAAKAPPVYVVSVAPIQSQAKTAPLAVVMKAQQPEAAPAIPAATPQQRVAKKVQMLYGRV